MFDRQRFRPFASVSTLALLLFASACGGESGPAETADTPEAPGIDLAARAGLPVPAGAEVTRIAFGSCNRTDLPQPVWEPLVEADPDVWIWLGDNVYGDTEDMSVMRAKYEAQLDTAGYQALLATAEITGTWDDHDFGANNAGNEYPMRAESQKELLDFLGVPADDARRTRAGVYGSHTWGPEGRQVKLILLDSRYHRDEPGSDGTVLGEDQWAWLENELSTSTAQIHLIANGIQFLQVDHRYEKWDNFPSERTRMLDLLASTGVQGAVMLSGDRHISELAMLPDAPIGYPLYEVTSSGMTHSWDDNPGETNRYRVGELYTQQGFGMIEIDWEGGELALQLRDLDNRVAVEQRITFEELGITGG